MNYPVGTRVAAVVDAMEPPENNETSYYFAGDKGTVVADWHGLRFGADGVWVRFDEPREGDGVWFVSHMSSLEEIK